jgi:hypothetical protein
MATLRQKRLAKKLVEAVSNGDYDRLDTMLVSAGYDETTAKATPGRVIAAKGVQEEMRILGFDPETAKGVVSEILTNVEEKARDRLTAADMTFKVHGTYAPIKAEVLQVNIDQARLEELALLSHGIKTNVRTKYVKSN